MGEKARIIDDLMCVLNNNKMISFWCVLFVFSAVVSSAVVSFVRSAMRHSVPQVGLLRSLPMLMVAVLFSFGCASMSAREKRWTAAGTGVLAGSIMGAAVTPGGERRELHSSYWGAMLGLASYFAADLLISDSEQSAALRLENEKLGLQLQVIQNANTVLLKEGNGYFKTGSGASGPSGGSGSGEDLFSGSGKKAKWKLFQIDRWVKEGPSRLYHQDRMVELVPVGDEETKGSSH